MTIESEASAPARRAFAANEEKHRSFVAPVVQRGTPLRVMVRDALYRRPSVARTAAVTSARPGR
jgi:hypothetical protein